MYNALGETFKIFAMSWYAVVANATAAGDDVEYNIEMRNTFKILLSIIYSGTLKVKDSNLYITYAR